MNRIVIIANKTWEVEPVLNAILNSQFNSGLILPNPLDYPRKSQQGQVSPRAVWTTDTIQIEIWAVQDVMPPFVSNPPIVSKTQYYSSSQIKDEYIGKIFETGPQPLLVVAFGTAACPDVLGYNGSVVVGSNIFVHNGHPDNDNPYSKLNNADFEKLITSSVSDSFFDVISMQLSDPFIRDRFTQNLLLTPLSPASPNVIINKQYLALSSVNVTDPTEYAQKDTEGLQSVIQAQTGKRLISVETTHGIIRIHSGNTPFIFVSSISNRVGFFGTEVAPKINAQNFAASFNGGVFLSLLINMLLNGKILN